MRDEHEIAEKDEHEIAEQEVAMLKQTLERISKDPMLMAEACFEGLKLMLQSSDFPVLPRLLITNGISPTQWFRGMRSASDIMAADMVKGIGLPLKAEEGKKEAEEKRLLDILEWEKLFREVLSPKAQTIKNLGLVWYLSMQGGENWVEVASDFVDPKELAEEVRHLAGELEERSMVYGVGENLPKVKWRDVFRIPL